MVQADSLKNKLNTFQRVRELTGWHAVAFSATLVERMQPNYQLFCQATEFADPSQFQNTLSLIWEWLIAPKAKVNFAVQLEKIEDVTPDAARFDNYGVYPAIDAAMSLTSTLLLAMGEDPQGAVVASKLSQGGVEAFIEATSEDSLTDQDIKEHPLMQWEIAFQTELLDLLESMKSGSESAKKLKLLALEEGMSNIGIDIS